eukprot:360591-Chlamydomonas_euryale.AAC.17
MRRQVRNVSQDTPRPCSEAQLTTRSAAPQSIPARRRRAPAALSAPAPWSRRTCSCFGHSVLASAQGTRITQA